jgi:hypothetical protein
MNHTVAQDTLKKSLNLTDKEHMTLANYGLCDTYDGGSVPTWQHQTMNEVKHFDQMEMELGEPVFEPGDKSIIISILNR